MSFSDIFSITEHMTALSSKLLIIIMISMLYLKHHINIMIISFSSNRLVSLPAEQFHRVTRQTHIIGQEYKSALITFGRSAY